MRVHLCIVILVLLFCGCESKVNTITVTMKDGTAITTTPLQTYYPNEDGFVHGVSFAFQRKYDTSVFQKVEYKEDSIGKVTGYDQSFVGRWEIAKFGEWIRNFGLEPGKAYYVATKVYVKYLSMPPVGLQIIPDPEGRFMGYCPDLEKRTFRVYRMNEEHLVVLITSVRYIGYDVERNRVDCEVPSFPGDKRTKFTWRFKVTDDGWD